MTAPWKIVRMNILPNCRLELTFVDGLHGIVDLSDMSFTGVFEPMARIILHKPRLKTVWSRGRAVLILHRMAFTKK